MSWLDFFRTTPAASPAPAGVDVFAFEESVVANGPHVVKHVPPPGHIKIEVADERGEVLAMDTIKAEKPAPRGSWKPVESCLSTLYGVPIGSETYEHQEFSLPVSLIHRVLSLPNHLTDKPGASQVRVWWSCENG